jgi:DNA-binding beta-propeller fold protein YncE
MGKELRGSIARRLRFAFAVVSVIAIGSLAVPASAPAANHGDLTPQFCLEDPDTGPDSCVPAPNVALVGLRGLAIGPGGPASEYDHIYAASEVGDAVSIVLDGGFFSPITCWGDDDTGDPDCANLDSGLDTATSVAVSPDGKNLYVASYGDDAVVTYSLLPGTTEELGTFGCIDDNDPPQGPDTCADSTDGLDGANSVAVSPDGKSVYVASREDDAVVRFDRNLTTGALTPADCWDDNDSGADGCGHVTNGLTGAMSVTVSPDNKSVYATSGITGGDDAIVHLHRDTGTGELTAAECYDDNDSGADTCLLAGETNGLGGVKSPVVSPDGTSLYVAGTSDDAVTRFTRAADGTLTPADCIDDHDVGQGPDDCGVGNTVPALDGVHSLSISPDGRSVYVTSFLDQAVVGFDRNATSGLLTFLGCIDDNDTGPDLCTQTTNGLNGASGIVTSPDGTAVYAAGFQDDALVWFDRTDLEAPQTTIVAGPAEGSSIGDSTPSFGFASTEISDFSCRVDGQAFAPCAAAFTAPELAVGQHTLNVFATDQSGNADTTPASRSFTVLDTTAPDTAVKGGTKFKTRKKKARVSFTFTATEPNAAFECSFDGAPFSGCASPLTFKARRGLHSLSVRAADSAGNRDASPAAISFKVKKKRPRR